MEKGEKRPIDGPLLVETVKSLSRRDMGEGDVDIGRKRIPPWAYVALWWDLGLGNA